MLPMQILSRWVPRLSNVAYSPSPVHRVASTGRPLLAASRWRASALARRVPPGFPASSSLIRRVSSYVPPANSGEDDMTASGNANFADEDASRTTTLEALDSKPDTSGEIVEFPDDVFPMEIFADSSHRDGSIYSGTDRWKRIYHISDRNETWLDSTMFSEPTDCRMYNGTCMLHLARDSLDPLLNYIVNFSRDDPIIVKQGSLISMAGPKRGIELVGTILIEYDMKIKAGEDEKEDLQLIDGVSLLDNIDTWDRTPFTCRFHGNCGAIDAGVSRLNFAYQATIEVIVSQVQSSFSMRLGCFTSGLDEEIRLFDGAIGEPRGLNRAVVAVASDDQMELKFKVAADSCIPAEYCCCFETKQHGRATQEINTGFALIAVKVTWSTLNKPRS